MPETFYVDFSELDDDGMNEFQAMMDAIHDAWVDEANALARELCVSISCAMDILYLRSRSRHTDELEEELIRLYEAGTPPNMCEFGN